MAKYTDSLTYVSVWYDILISVCLQPCGLVVVAAVSVATDVQTLWSIADILE